MESLTQTDRRNLHNFFERVSEPGGLEGFASRVLPAVHDLIPGNQVVWASTDLVKRRSAWKAFPPQPIPDSEPFDRHIEEHPVFQYWRNTRWSSALKTSDLVSSRQFHDLALYQDFFKALDVEDSLGVLLPVTGDHVIGMAINRDRPNFTEHDRLLVDTIQPFLLQAYRTAQALSLLFAAMAADEIAAILLNGHDELLELTDQSRQLVENCYHGWDLLTRGLPEPVKAALQGYRATQTATEIVVCGEHGRQFRLDVLTADAHSDQRLVVLRAETAQDPWRSGLTAREQEIVDAIQDGKSNSEIADQLFISRRTVEKHFENIFVKLDVHSRAALLSLTARSRRRPSYPRTPSRAKLSPSLMQTMVPPGSARTPVQTEPWLAD